VGAPHFAELVHNVEVLALGTFLFMAFSGMRFGDIQRVMMHKMQYDDRSPRGLSWKTKTCSSGVPFGVLCSGFLSRGSHTWLQRFFTTLDQVLTGQDRTRIDFMLPSLQGVTFRQPISAMSYSEALFHFRRFLVLPWRSAPLEFSNAAHYTIHGLKSTFLSWASQLQIAPELRRLQGKHKDPFQSTRLYSRDDVDGSLTVQDIIIKTVQAGWRPHTPLIRGGQIPLAEPTFVLESFSKTKVPFNWKFFHFADSPQLVVDTEATQVSEDSTSSESASDSTSSQGSAEAAVATKKQKREDPLIVDELDCGCYRNTLHVIMDWHIQKTEADPTFVATACGRHFASDLIHRRNDLSLDSNQVLCTHPGCRKGWQAIGALG